MEILEIFCAVAFSLCGVGVAIYACRQRKRPGMKHSASRETLASLPEDPNTVV